MIYQVKGKVEFGHIVEDKGQGQGQSYLKRSSSGGCTRGTQEPLSGLQIRKTEEAEISKQNKKGATKR